MILTIVMMMMGVVVMVIMIEDLPTEESLLVKLSRRANVALVKGLLVIIILKMDGWKLSKVSLKLVI